MFPAEPSSPGDARIEPAPRICAAPVVAYDVGGISDWLQEAHNGYLVPVGDATLLAERIQRLIEMPSLAQKLGANGQKYILKYYKPAGHLTTLLDIFSNTQQVKCYND